MPWIFTKTLGHLSTWLTISGFSNSNKSFLVSKSRGLFVIIDPGISSNTFIFDCPGLSSFPGY